MFFESAHDGTIPAPGFPGSGRISPGGLAFRRFGTTAQDLAVDFDASNRAALVTRLLTLCTVDSSGALPTGFYGELSAGKRLEFLLALAAGGREPAVSLVFKCAGCDEEIELELELAEISELQREADETVAVTLELSGATHEFRKPRGADLEIWGDIVAVDDREAIVRMLETLAVEKEAVGCLSNSDLTAVESALDEADPLVNFVCRVGCGECGEENEFVVDLTETALETLRRAQFQLTVAVHRLASHYHWTEDEIFAVPDRRRRQYLELIAAGRR